MYWSIDETPSLWVIIKINGEKYVKNLCNDMEATTKCMIPTNKNI
jgi:hypothetical protein